MSDSIYLRQSIEWNLSPYPDFAAALPCKTNSCRLNYRRCRHTFLNERCNTETAIQKLHWKWQIKLKLISSVHKLCSNCRPFRMDARSSLEVFYASDVVNSHVDSRLFKATPDVDHPLFIHATDFCLIDTTLHDNPDLVIDWVEIWDIWMSQVRRNKVWCFLA